MSPPSDGAAGRFAMQHNHPQILDGFTQALPISSSSRSARRIATTTFTNVFNRINDTAIDYPTVN
jgi:hypothetical protein